MSKKALIFWFTGLSGSGKTTIAGGIEQLLKRQGYSVLILDGDDVRTRLHKHLGFTRDDIKENNALISQLCGRYRSDHDVILVPIISPYIEDRSAARALLKDGFYEVYCSVDLETVIERDVKGLYAKARNKEISNLIGYSPGAAYEPPPLPDYVIDSRRESVEVSLERFHQFIINALGECVSV